MRTSLKPYHQHPLLHDYSDWRGQASEGGGSAIVVQFRAEWFCPTCAVEIKGPPFEVGEYTIDRVDVPPLGPPLIHKRIWCVFMRSLYARDIKMHSVALFESSRKRDALKHARELERERVKLLGSLRRLRTVEGVYGK